MFFKIKIDENNNKYVETDAFGYDLINNPRWNKGTSFTTEERTEFQLHGIVPPRLGNLNENVKKVYEVMIAKDSDLEKHIYLRALQDRDETLFYALLDYKIDEIMPLVYTPTVGLACQKFSEIYRRPRGLFISFPNRDKINEMLASSYFDNVEVIVVSDGERILGLGEQGAGGMGIPIGKLSLYTACAGIAPEKTLAILLDSGTDNQANLDNPLYIGWKNQRIRGIEYDEFVESFIKAVKIRFPKVVLQFEDFAQINANRLLSKYKDELCTFNDDIQGTAAIVVSAIISAVNASKVDLNYHCFVIVGAGSAGVGISNLIVEYLIYMGVSATDAYQKLFLVDKNGLLTENIANFDFQKNFVKTNQQLANWKFIDKFNIDLLETVTNCQATAIIGVSAQRGIFSENVIKQMAKNSLAPIVFPLSNPTDNAEAHPNNIIKWSRGTAIVGSGSPFPPIVRNGLVIRVDQVNNCYIFPGIGLGILASGARRITDRMFLVAAIALAELSPAKDSQYGNLLPPLYQVKKISKYIALAVAKEAIKLSLSNLPPMDDEELAKIIDGYMWKPEYLPYKRI